MKGIEDDGKLTTASTLILRKPSVDSAESAGPDMLAVRSDWRTPQCQADKVQGSYKKCK